MFDEDDSGWEPSTERVIRVGHVFYWITSSVAFLMLVFVIGDLGINWAQDRPILRVFALLMALLIWLLGRACRSLSDTAASTHSPADTADTATLVMQKMEPRGRPSAPPPDVR